MGRFTPRSCAARPALRVVVLTGMAVAAAAWILGTAEHRYARLSVCRTLIAGEYEKGRMFFGGGYWTDRVRRPPGAIFCSTRATAPLPSGGHYPATFSAEILCGGSHPTIGIGAGASGVRVFRHSPGPLVGISVVVPCWLPLCGGLLALWAIKPRKGNPAQGFFLVGKPRAGTSGKGICPGHARES